MQEAGFTVNKFSLNPGGMFMWMDVTSQDETEYTALNFELILYQQPTSLKMKKLRKTMLKL